MVSIYLHVYLSIQKYNRYSGEYKGGHLEKLLPPRPWQSSISKTNFFFINNWPFMWNEYSIKTACILL